MPVPSEQAIHDIYSFALFVLLLTFGLIIFALARRANHERYYRELDKLRKECLPILEAILAGSIPYDFGISELKVRGGSGRAGMMERVLVGVKPTPSQAALFRQISTDLGLIRTWQKGLAAPGQLDSKPNFVRSRSGWRWLPRWPDYPDRAKAAEYLGMLRHQPSSRLMVRALNDPNAGVRTAAVRAIGTIGEPRTFPILLRELRDAAKSDKPRCSISTLRLALSRFPLRLASHVSPLLLDANPDVRFLGAEVIQEMIKHAAVPGNLRLPADIFPPALLDAFVDKLCHDPSANVRARVAIVLGYIADSRAQDALASLLKDSEWFVRLQAAKSVGRHMIQGLEHQIAECLADSDWRVREAATHALGKHARLGADLLLNHFLMTSDAYMREQIAEEAERSGLVNGWLSHLGERGFEKATQALSQLIDMGKTDFLKDMLEKRINARQRSILSASLGLDPPEQGQILKRQAASH